MAREDAGRKFVKFTRAAGERIGRAVRKVEQSSRPCTPLTYQHSVPAPSNKLFRVGTVTGGWAKGTLATVTLRNSTVTLSAENFLYTLYTDSGTKQVNIAKDGTGWFLLSVEHEVQNVIYNVSQSSTALTFDRMSIWVPSKVQTTPVLIALAECATGYTGT